MSHLGFWTCTSSFVQPSHSYVDSLSLVARQSFFTLILQGPCKFIPHSWSQSGVYFTLDGGISSHSQSEFMHRQLPKSRKVSHLQDLETECDGRKLNFFLDVQTLRKFPIEKLHREVVLVRFDSTVLLDAEDFHKFSIERTLSSIKYLYDAGAKVLLVSNWGKSTDHILLSEELQADRLSSLLQVKVMPAKSCTRMELMKKLENADIILLDNLTKFRGEVSNCPLFSETLSSGVSLFVNDAFSVSHKILASTVGVVRFCHASVAGFHFEEQLHQLKKISETSRQPYIAIIGGSNFLEKANALYILASQCDGLILLGNLAIQIMNALGIPVPSHLVDCQAVDEVLKLIQLAKMRKIPIYFPKDVLCVNNSNPDQSEIFPSNGILSGWTPKDLGPTSLKEMSDLLLTCKKVLFIGSPKFYTSGGDIYGPSQLVCIFERISRTGCNVILVGNAACKAIAGTAHSSVHYTMVRNASVVWEFLKGRKLPGVAALDRVYFLILTNWKKELLDFELF